MAPHLSRWLWLVKWFLAIPHLRRARLPLGRVLRVDGHRVLRGAVHGALPARDLRLQRGRAALVVARQPSTPSAPSAPTSIRRSRSVTCPSTRHGSRSTTRRTSAAASRSWVGGCSASRSSASRRSSPGPDGRSGSSAFSFSSPASCSCSRSDTRGDLRPRARPRPLGAARRRLRSVHDPRVPAVPARCRPARAALRHAAGSRPSEVGRRAAHGEPAAAGTSRRPST